MPPPASYVQITGYPFSVVVPQADFNIANERWFRIDVTVPTVVGFFIDIGGTFSPRYDLYESDGSTLLRSVNSAANPSWYYPVQAGTYYLWVRRRGGGASNFDFTFHADSRPWGDFDVQTGAIVINDDVGTLLPAAIVDPSTSEIIGYISIPAGEHGVALSTGQSAWYDRFGQYGAAGTVALFNSNNEYIASTSQVFTDPPSMSASADEAFILEYSTREIYRINLTNGTTTLVATPTSATGFFTSFGVNVDGTIAYYVDASEYTGAFNPSDNVIHAWDLDSDVALPDLYTEPDLASDVGGFAVTPNIWPGDILVLPDGSVVTHVRNEDATHDILLHISSAGTLLHSYTYLHAARQINHMTYANNGSASVMVWFYAPGDADGIITEVLLSDGSESNTVTFEQFSAGVNNNGNSSTIFGVSNSCTFAILGSRYVIPPDHSEQCPCPACECPTEHPEVPPSQQPPATSTGGVLPPVEPTWERNCSGDGQVPTQADATDPESWAA